MKKVSEVYKKLCHYTTWEGLYGILEAQTLWATNYRFLNDYSEIILFKDKLISLITPYVLEGFEKRIKSLPDIIEKIQKEGGLPKVVQHDSEGFINLQYDALGDEIYILSFCGQLENPTNSVNNGLLSQWRGYGAGGGAALVFDTQKLEQILEVEETRFEYSAIFLADIVYSDNEQKLKDELSDNLSIIADVSKQFFDHEILNQQRQIDASKAYAPFVNCISRYKHYGFSEENEVRVVALPTVLDERLLKLADLKGVRLKPEKKRAVRQKNGRQIPYIALFNSTDIKLPIEKIIVGPHRDKEARAMRLRERFKKLNIEVACSEIPYVE